MSNTSAYSGGGTSNRWEDWGNLLLAIWLFISPWALQFTPNTSSEAAVNAAAWNAWISAIVVGVIAIAALYRLQQLEEWINAVVGIWIGASLWLMGFSNLTTATLNAVIVGVLIVCLSGRDLYEIFTGSPRSSVRA